MIDAVSLKYEICEGLDERLDGQLNDKASGIYATFYSIGMILAPIIGGPLFDAINYRGTCDFLGLCFILYTAFYFVFNVGISVFKQDKIIK